MGRAGGDGRERPPAGELVHRFRGRPAPPGRRVSGAGPAAGKLSDTCPPRPVPDGGVPCRFGGGCVVENTPKSRRSLLPVLAGLLALALVGVAVGFATGYFQVRPDVSALEVRRD